MTIFNQFAGRWMVQAMGWTLLHFVWEGALVAVLLWCVLELMDRRRVQARYAVACCALGVMVVLPVATLVHVGMTEHRLAVELRNAPVEVGPGMVIEAEMGGPAAPWTERVAAELDRSAPWVLLAWFVGAMVFLGRLQMGFLVARRMRWMGTSAAPDGLLEVFERLRERLGVGRAVRLMQSALVEAPTVIGWLKPVVLVPASCLTGLSTMQVEAILCHELAHIRRHDYLVSVVQSVVEALLFYHPAVWWVSRQVRRERECCCDELAVEMGGDRLGYARALSWLEERRSLSPAMVLGANGGVLTMRIKRVLGVREGSAASQVAAGVVLAVMVLAGGAMVGELAHAQTSGAAGATTKSDAQGAIAEDTAGLGKVYRQWVNQDVRWIITSQERAAFLRLTNDNERDQFIKQFWERRNPTPGSAVNSYKVQYERRIAYANQHFVAESAGWRSDRGHIYIAYGPPDSIDSHPSGGELSSYPYEVWNYRSIAGVGDNVALEFVDTCRCGEYHYTVDGRKKDVPSTAARVSFAAKILAPPEVSGTAPGATFAGEKIREINFKGLDSVTLTEVAERFKRAGVEMHVETPYDPVQVGRAAGVLKEMIAERGRQSVVRVSVKAISPGAVAVLFDVKEGAVNTGGVRPVSYLAQSAGPKPDAVQGNGAIVGMVFDQTGALVPRAAVTAVNTDTGARVSAETDNTGTFSFSPLPTGDYNVEVEARGFERLLQENVRVSAGENTGLKMKLSVGEVAQTLSVTDAPGAAAKSGALPVRSGVMAGQLISQVNPVYPAEAKKAHVQGVVVLKAMISKTGDVETLHVVSGPKELVVSAVDAVRQWKYKPYLLNGQPTEVETTIHVHYTFGGDGEGAPPPPPPSSGEQAKKGSLPLRVSSGVMAGQLISKVDPVYPPDAKKAGVQGAVVLKAMIAKDGTVEGVQVVSGPKELTASAVDAVRQWVYKPFLLNGEPVEVQTTITVNYSLADGGKAKGGKDESGDAAGQPKKIGGPVSAPMLVHSVEPEMTEAARKAKKGGVVIVGFWVDKNGLPTHVHVVKEAGYGLDAEAVKAVEQYRFKPAMEDGKPVTVALNVEVNFQFF